MKIELRRTSEDFSEKQSLAESPEALKLEAEGAAFDEPVKVELVLNKSQDQLICRGRAGTRVNLECSRCLKEYRYNLSSDLAFVIDLLGNKDQETSEEEGYYVVDQTDTHFDISGLVRETLLLSLPLKPLCSEKCKGLCPICGTDLNQSRCDCVQKSFDPRWDQLRSLLKGKP